MKLKGRVAIVTGSSQGIGRGIAVRFAKEGAKEIYSTGDLLDARNRGIPMSRHGKPEEIGKAAVFLASDDASFVTGENLSVGGGSLVSMYHLIHQLAG